MLKLNLDNPFQTFALSSEQPNSINWEELGQKTVNLCQITLNNPDWSAGTTTRSNWLWEQENAKLQSTALNAWGWDCLAMLNLVKSKL